MNVSQTNVVWNGCVGASEEKQKTRERKLGEKPETERAITTGYLANVAR